MSEEFHLKKFINLFKSATQPVSSGLYTRSAVKPLCAGYPVVFLWT